MKISAISSGGTMYSKRYGRENKACLSALDFKSADIFYFSGKKHYLKKSE